MTKVTASGPTEPKASMTLQDKIGMFKELFADLRAHLIREATEGQVASKQIDELVDLLDMGATELDSETRSIVQAFENLDAKTMEDRLRARFYLVRSSVAAILSREDWWKILDYYEFKEKERTSKAGYAGSIRRLGLQLEIKEEIDPILRKTLEEKVQKIREFKIPFWSKRGGRVGYGAAGGDPAV